MSANHYRFETRWRVKATPELVTAILSDAEALPRWWPEVYLSVEPTGPLEFALETRGWLPYTLRWSLHVTETRNPYGFSLLARGDLQGSGVWTFARDGDWTNIHYLWIVEAEKPLLRWFSFLLKPVFAANHRWAMARGEEALKREIARR